MCVCVCVCVCVREREREVCVREIQCSNSATLSGRTEIETLAHTLHSHTLHSHTQHTTHNTHTHYTHMLAPTPLVTQFLSSANEDKSLSAHLHINTRVQMVSETTN